MRLTTIAFITLVAFVIASALFLLSARSPTPELLAQNVDLLDLSGADPTGSRDLSSALQACLNKAGPGGTCNVPGGKFQILDDLMVPAATTLSCGLSYLDRENVPRNFGLMPALMLDGRHTIRAGGDGAAIKNCLIYRNRMDFPALNSSAYTGIALSDEGYGNFTLVDNVIIGFKTCIYGQGTRPYWIYNYVDCAGAPSGVPSAAVELNNGNTDSGYIDKLKIQPLAASDGSCSSRRRPGTGLRVNGINFVGDAVVQDFEIAQIEVGGYLLASKLWTDFTSSCLPGSSSIGLKVSAGGAISASILNINSTQTGLTMGGRNSPANNWIGNLFFNAIGQDCLVIGGEGFTGGNLTINSLGTNAASTSNCGRYAIEYADTTNGSNLTIGSAQLKGVNGGASPYIHASATNVSPGININIANLMTDLPPGASPFGEGFSAPYITSAAILNIPAVANAPVWVVIGTDSVTAFGGVYAGQMFSLLFGGNTTIVNGNNIILPQGISSRRTIGGSSFATFYCFANPSILCKEIAWSP